jgi:hypothetical protein
MKLVLTLKTVVIGCLVHHDSVLLILQAIASKRVKQVVSNTITCIRMQFHLAGNNQYSII